MIGRTLRAFNISWLLTLVLAIPLAGCLSSIGGDESPPDDPSENDPGPPGDGDEDGDGNGDGDTPPIDNCAGDPCDLYDQCGCEGGQACDLDPSKLAEGDTLCRSVESPGQTQATCDSDPQCAAGYGCFGSPGHCRKYCDEEKDCGGGHCIVRVVYSVGEGKTADVPDATLCTKPCKPDSATGSGCPDNFACHFRRYDPNGAPDSGDEYHYADCLPAGDGGDAASCEADGDRDCQAGFGCFAITYTDDTVKDECRQICVFNVGDEPGPRECVVGECRQLGTNPVIDGVEYGTCF